MELLFKLESIDNLNEFPLAENVTIRWINIPGDLPLIHEFRQDRNPNLKYKERKMRRDLISWQKKGCYYCALFKDDHIIAMSAVEKYSSDKWETADVRVIQAERGNGYAKNICYFVTKYILENGYTATCRTENHNIFMQSVIKALGFVPC